jgi:hypothetical protein
VRCAVGIHGIVETFLVRYARSQAPVSMSKQCLGKGVRRSYVTYKAEVIVGSVGLCYVLGKRCVRLEGSGWPSQSSSTLGTWVEV